MCTVGVDSVSSDWQVVYGRSIALSIALKVAADKLVTSPALTTRVKQQLIDCANNDRVRMRHFVFPSDHNITQGQHTNKAAKPKTISLDKAV